MLASPAGAVTLTRVHNITPYPSVYACDFLCLCVHVCVGMCVCVFVCVCACSMRIDAVYRHSAHSVHPTASVFLEMVLNLMFHLEIKASSDFAMFGSLHVRVTFSA